IAKDNSDYTLTSTDTAFGTPAYLDPEVVQTFKYNKESDLWGFWTTILFCLTSRVPYGVGDPFIIMQRAKEHNPDLEGLPSALQDIFYSVLEPEVDYRMNTNEALARIRRLAG
ncbi:MAG: hypothetical protein LBN03_01220, partial [Bifidobacteriaceae bacterium]|nr:hypothetical protein [Bifidobacteriaceae bacterium]